MKNIVYVLMLTGSLYLHSAKVEAEPTVAFASWQDYWDSELAVAAQKYADGKVHDAVAKYEYIASNCNPRLTDAARQTAQQQFKRITGQDAPLGNAAVADIEALLTGAGVVFVQPAGDGLALVQAIPEALSALIKVCARDAAYAPFVNMMSDEELRIQEEQSCEGDRLMQKMCHADELRAAGDYAEAARIYQELAAAPAPYYVYQGGGAVRLQAMRLAGQLSE